jgi:predicted secreted protein
LGQLSPLVHTFFISLFQPHQIDFHELLYSITGAVCAGLIFLSWYGLGALCLKTISVQDEDHHLGWAKQTAFGAGIWSLLWYFLGLLHLYKTFTALISAGLGMLLFIFAFSRRQKNIQPVEKFSLISRIVFALLLFLSLLALSSALAPPTAKDTLLYHFALPKIYANAGGIVDEHYNIAQFLPLGAETHNVWAMLLGRVINTRAGEAAAGVIQFSYLLLLLVFVYGWVKEQTQQRSWALLGALLIASVPTVYYVAANAYVDLALALYLALATHAAARWWITNKRAYLIQLALALGFALCVKLTAVFLIVPLILLFLFKAESLKKSGALDTPALHNLIISALFAICLAALISGPWYLRTWARTGSPVFPFYLNLWSGHAPGWDTERSLMFQFINQTYGGYPKNELDYLLAPVKLSLQSQLEQPAFYDGVLGVTFLFGLPLLIYAFWKIKPQPEIIIAATFSAALFLCWLFTSQQLRYLLPALPPLAVAIIVALFQFSHSDRKLNFHLQTALLVPILTSTLVIVFWFLLANPLPTVLGTESRQDYLTRRLDYYPYYHLINTQLPSTVRIWLINMRRDTYHLERPYFSDYMFEDHTIKRFVDQSSNLTELQQRARSLGISHLLVRHDILLDYARSPIVDERQGETRNREKMQILQKLLSKEQVLAGDDKFRLLALDKR